MKHATHIANKREMPELLKKLNEAVESVDDRFKSNDEIKGIVMIRWFGKSEEHKKAVTSLGTICAGCIVAVGEYLARETLSRAVVDYIS